MKENLKIMVSVSEIFASGCQWLSTKETVGAYEGEGHFVPGDLDLGDHVKEIVWWCWWWRTLLNQNKCLVCRSLPTVCPGWRYLEFNMNGNEGTDT